MIIAVMLMNVTVEVLHNLLGIKFVASFIYGANSKDDRNQLWNSQSTSSMAVASQVSCILLGDFNIVRNASEKWVGLGIDALGVQSFNTCIDSLEVEDVTYEGCFHKA
ncbi:hypothetical protein Vadar_028212 [Vaccinium darrowii]|uniref:Uncharacterized protein n=1 Tax=Vaccinium darrowii TaxID=229202 RepID=A0ACB7YQD4_9ERIC|nr:hypothetical protein Vadar_028212 [Vaccinium darrowii]